VCWAASSKTSLQYPKSALIAQGSGNSNHPILASAKWNQIHASHLAG